MREYIWGTFETEYEFETPRYNVSPSQLVPVVSLTSEGAAKVSAMRWGLVPYWEKSEKPKIAPINARSEEAFSKGMFKQGVQRRRCLIPADGFYEWKRLDEKTKFAFDIHLKGGRPFFMAGIYEQATEIRPDTFLVFTTRSNELMAMIHDRMPAILEAERAKQWLAVGEITPEKFAALTMPHNSADMEAIPISSLVNLPKNDVVEVLIPTKHESPQRAIAKKDLNSGQQELGF